MLLIEFLENLIVCPFADDTSVKADTIRKPLASSPLRINSSFVFVWEETMAGCDRPCVNSSFDRTRSRISASLRAAAINTVVKQPAVARTARSKLQILII